MHFVSSCSRPIHNVSDLLNRCLDDVSSDEKKLFFFCLCPNCSCHFDSRIVCARFRSQRTLNNPETIAEMRTYIFRQRTRCRRHRTPSQNRRKKRAINKSLGKRTEEARHPYQVLLCITEAINRIRSDIFPLLSVSLNFTVINHYFACDKKGSIKSTAMFGETHQYLVISHVPRSVIFIAFPCWTKSIPM